MTLAVGTFNILATGFNPLYVFDNSMSAIGTAHIIPICHMAAFC
jgi:hypothetical protein